MSATKPHMKVFLAFLAVASLCLADCWAIPVGLDTDSDGLVDLDEQSVEIEVPAGPSTENIPTVPTDYTFAATDELLLRGTGTCYGEGNQGLESGPEGLQITPPFPTVLPTAPFLALIARVGTGPWLLVGEETLLSPTTEGTLTFAVNDIPGGFGNNSGHYTVELGEGLGSLIDEPDSDGDGVLDGEDGAPTDPTETLDTDGDRLGNNVDPDDDNDGLYDSEEIGTQYNLFTLGATDEVVKFPTGIHLVADEWPVLKADGTITDGANDESSSPEGRTDLATAGLALVDPGEPLYKVMARLGRSEWIGVGTEQEIGFHQTVEFTEETHHLGDGTVNEWEVPTPEGVRWDEEFELEHPVLFDAVLSLDVWSTREDNKVLLNGSIFGRLCANRTNTWTRCRVPVTQLLFQEGTNTLTIAAGPDDDSLDTQSIYDDFMFRNVRLEFLPANFRLLEIQPHHLGDATGVPGFEVPDAEDTELAIDFTLTHLPEIGDATLLLDTFDVTTGRPDNPVFVNGTPIGVLCQRDEALEDFWEQCALTFDSGLLNVGNNRLLIQSATDPDSLDYDDFMVRFISIDLPLTSATRELVLGYNERLGEYADNTGGYDVTIGTPYGTDPLDPDSDGDNLPDGWEVRHDLNPLNPADGPFDSDEDGLLNTEEFERDTDPNVPDTDQDRIGDGAEVDQGTDPLDPQDPTPFDFDTNGVLDFNDVVEFSLWWQRAITELSFENVGDTDGSGSLDAMDVLDLLRRVPQQQ